MHIYIHIYMYIYLHMHIYIMYDTYMTHNIYNIGANPCARSLSGCSEC